MKALVTGGNGFVGSHVVAALREAGHEVRVLDRAPPRASLAGVEQVQADLLADDLAPAFEGVEVLVHLAALMRGSLDQMRRVSVDGAARVLEAMAASNCRRLVHASTFSIYHWPAIVDRVDEDSPIHTEATLGDADHYAIAKTEQERLVRERSAEAGWTLTVLRPSAIWGRGVWSEFVIGPRLGPLRVVIGPMTRPRLAYVENVALAFALAAARSGEPRELVLNVVDDPGPTNWRYARLVCSQIGGVAVPEPLWAGAVKARVATALTGGRGLPYFLRQSVFQSLHRPVAWSNQRLRDALQWTPRFSFEQAVRRATST